MDGSAGVGEMRAARATAALMAAEAHRHQLLVSGRLGLVCRLAGEHQAAAAAAGRLLHRTNAPSSAPLPARLCLWLLAQVHNGDISYARGYGSQWESFLDQMAPVLSRLPYLTAIGNHERDWPGTGDRFPAQYDSGAAWQRQQQQQQQRSAGGLGPMGSRLVKGELHA